MNYTVDISTGDIVYFEDDEYSQFKYIDNSKFSDDISNELIEDVNCLYNSSLKDYYSNNDIIFKYGLQFLALFTYLKSETYLNIINYLEILDLQPKQNNNIIILDNITSKFEYLYVLDFIMKIYKIKNIDIFFSDKEEKFIYRKNKEIKNIIFKNIFKYKAIIELS